MFEVQAEWAFADARFFYSCSPKTCDSGKPRPRASLRSVSSEGRTRPHSIRESAAGFMLTRPAKSAAVPLGNRASLKARRCAPSWGAFWLLLLTVSAGYLYHQKAIF